MSHLPNRSVHILLAGLLCAACLTAEDSPAADSQPPASPETTAMSSAPALSTTSTTAIAEQLRQVPQGRRVRLDPGDWVVSHFIVPFQLSLQRSWGMGVHDARIAEFILDLGGNELSSVALIARSGTSADSEAEELMQRQGIVISETQTGEMAGREAVRLDGHVEGRIFGVLLITGDGWEWGIDEGNGFRVWMFDQDEITVLAVVQADRSRLQEALRAGEQLLGTVSFLADE